MKNVIYKTYSCIFDIKNGCCLCYSNFNVYNNLMYYTNIMKKIAYL